MENEQIFNKIKYFIQSYNYPINVKRVRKGFNIYKNATNIPVVRLIPTGISDEVEILFWSHRDKWERLGEGSKLIKPIDDALFFIDRDPMGYFW